MSLPDKNSQQPDDLTIFEMKRHDQINEKNNQTESSTPVAITKSTSMIPTKDEDFKVKKHKNVDEQNPPKFSISISKSEIEEDLYAITGKRNLRCRNKRDKKKEGLNVNNFSLTCSFIITLFLCFFLCLWNYYFCRISFQDVR